MNYDQPLLLPYFLRRVVFSASLLAVAAMSSEAPQLRAAAPEVRGTWLSTTGPDHIQSGLNTATIMADLRNIGLNTAYVETWKNGYTNYPSPTLAALTGGPDRSTFLGTTRDLVQETLIQAHRNQMDYIGWFEYGMSAQFIGDGGTPSNPLATYMKNHGWLLQDQTGKYGNASNGYAWMNPAVPQVRQYLINITLEAINRYDLDGIQYDDRLAWPKEFGWDTTTAQLYLAETGRSLPTNVNDSQFRAWRQSKVTQFATELSQAVRTARPDLLLSVSPSITGFAETNYNANWTSWQDQGLFDEYVPQAYRSTLTVFNSIIDAQTNPFLPNDLDQCAVGISINTSPVPTWSDVQGMIQRTRSEGAAGHVLWYSNGVHDVYATQLTSFYDVAGQGQAANPHFDAPRRPAPIVASLTSPTTSSWNVDVVTPGHYRVVAKIGSYWSEVAKVTYEIGSFPLTVANATQVELLADRRPLTIPDFNGDALVDAADYVLWRETIGSTADLRADANADGMVDIADYNRWRAGLGQTIGMGAGTVTSAAVPEPSSAWILLFGMLTIRHRH